MHTVQVQLSDPAYAAVAQVAEASGLSVEAVIADQVEAEFIGGDELPAEFWTPEILAALDAASDEIRAGKGLTSEEVDARLAANRTAWLAAHAH